MRGALCVLALALASACSTKPAHVGIRPPQVKDPAAEASYHDVVQRYTARKEIYDRLETRVFLAATYQSWPFREARTRRVAEFQVWPEPLLQENLAKERAEADASTEFFVGIHANDRLFDDFGKKDSIWRIALVTPSGELTPTKIARVGRSTLDLRALYPWLYDFWVGYRITFPKADFGSGPVKLKLASTVGQAEFEFPAQ